MAGSERTRQGFPSRQYRYPYAVVDPTVQADEPADPRELLRFIAGRDATPTPLTLEEVRASVQDRFVRLVLQPESASGPPPLSLRAVLAALDATPMTEQRSFVVADGGQVAWSAETADLQRNFRLAIVRQAPGDQQADILISASTDIDSATNFLQVIGWDATAGAFQFYERRFGRWVWAGSAWDALEPGSRGRGPFDSHINGALNMKELKFPWLHWHSPSAAIADAVLAPDDPLRSEPLWTDRRLADEFERTVVRPGIARWTDSRFARRTVDGSLTRLHEFFRQVLGTSTVNLISAPTSSEAVAIGHDVQLPLTFLVDVDALLGTLELEPEIPDLLVPAEVYRQCLARFDARVSDGRHTFTGDTHFVFVVPEPAFEDTLVLEGLIARGVLEPRLAASLLMVDGENPVFSSRRASLAAFVPDSARLGEPAAFTAAFVERLRASGGAGIPGRAEHDLLANLAVPENRWRDEFAGRLSRQLAAVAPRLHTLDGFAPLYELAESRRREFRRRPLAEFRLTTPTTNIPDTAPLLEMTTGAAVRPRSDAHMALTRFDAPGFLDDLGDSRATRVERLDRPAARRCAEPRRRRAGVERRPAAAVLQPAEDAAGGRRGHQGHRLAGLPACAPGDLGHRPPALAARRQQPRQPGRVLRVERDARSGDRQDHARDLHLRRARVLAVPRRGRHRRGLLELYRQHISPDVQHADLFQAAATCGGTVEQLDHRAARCTWSSAATRWARRSSSPRPPPSSAGAAARRSPKPRR